MSGIPYWAGGSMHCVKFLFIVWPNFCCEHVSSQRSPRSQSSLKVAMVTYLKMRRLKDCFREVSKHRKLTPLTGAGRELQLFKDWTCRLVLSFEKELFNLQRVLQEKGHLVLGAPWASTDHRFEQSRAGADLCFHFASLCQFMNYSYAESWQKA